MKRLTKHFRTLLNEIGNEDPDISDHIKQQLTHYLLNECPDITEVIKSVNAFMVTGSHHEMMVSIRNCWRKVVRSFGKRLLKSSQSHGETKNYHNTGKMRSWWRYSRKETGVSVVIIPYTLYFLSQEKSLPAYYLTDSPNLLNSFSQRLSVVSGQVEAPPTWYSR